jgi:hypothetical protein
VRGGFDANTEHKVQEAGACMCHLQWSVTVMLQWSDSDHKVPYGGLNVVSQWCYSCATMMVQWCYGGVTVVLQWCCSGAAVVLQWCYSGVTVMLQ